MALSEYKQAIYDSLTTPEERRIIDRFYAMSHQDFLKNYGHNMGELIDRFDRTRLWPHQKENISFRHDRLKKNPSPKGFITTLPAGAGKTEIFINSILENTIEVTEKDKVKLITPPTVILVPSEDLVKQTYSELKEREPNLMVGQDYGKVKNIQPLTVTTYDTFVAKVEQGKIRPGDVSLMVMDEAHRGLSEPRLNVFRRFINNTLIDSYSASPAFDAMKNLYKLLGKDSVIPGPNDRELTTMGFLAECHNVLMRVSIKTDDLPEALKNNPERYNDFLEELKIQAAKEFYLTYADEQTGQRAFGKPAVGFARYVRHAQRAAEVFDEAIRDHAERDKFAAKLIKRYTHPTQVLSRSMGDAEVDSAFNRILPAHKRTADEGENLITFTTKMAREGTNIPRWKVAIGLQTPNSSVDQVQTRGRARRKTGEELSFVLDVFVEEDGKIRGKPKFYYEAIDDPSIVRGVVTVTPDKEKVDDIVAEVLEFKNKQEMKDLVLGEGDAARKYAAKFNKLWDELAAHAKTEEKKKKPAPFMLDNEAVSYKIVVRNGDDENDSTKSVRKAELRVSEKAIDQFRAALGIPGQINSTWRDEERFQESVIGKKISDDREDGRPLSETTRINSERAEYYEGKFNALLHRAKKHFESQKRRKNPEPFIVAGEPFKMEERLDEVGNMVLAFHVDGAQAFRRALDVAPTPGYRFSNRQQFEMAVLEGAENQASIKRKIAQMWDAAEESYQKTRKPGTRCFIPFGDSHVEAANCFVGKDVDWQFSLDRTAVGIARRALGIAPITFDPATITWEKDITAIEEITKTRDGNPYLSEDKQSWLIEGKVYPLLRTSRSVASAKIDSLFKELLANPKMIIALNSGELRKSSEVIGEYINGQHNARYFDPEISDFIAKSIGLVPVLPESKKHWVTGYNALDLIKEKGTVENRKTLETQLDDLLKTPKKLIATNDGREIPVEQAMAKYRSGTVTAVFIDPQISDYIAKQRGLAKPLDESCKHWVSGSRALKIVGCKQTDDVVDRLKQACQRLLALPPDKEITFPDPETGKAKKFVLSDKIGLRIHWGNQDCYFDPEIAPFIRSEMGLLPLMPKHKTHWLSGSKALAELEMHPSGENLAKLSLALEKVLDSGESTIRVGRKDVPLDSVMGRFQTTKAGIYFDPMLIESGIITKQMVKDQVVNDTAIPNPARQNRRSIKPDSDHIRNRSGRSREGSPD